VISVAVDGRISVRHEDVFPVPVLVLGVEPVNDFEKVQAKVPDPQERDKDTGLRMWAASVLDPSAPQGRREIKVKIPAEVQPVPPAGLMAPVEFDGLQLIPYVDESRSRPRVAIAYRATGFRSRPRQSAA
jgi:hypothetical protein